MGSSEKFLEYLVGGTLVIIGLVAAVLILGPFIIGYGITIIAWRIYDEIRYRLFPPPYEPVYRPSVSPKTIFEERYTWIREPKAVETPLIKQQPEEKKEELKEEAEEIEEPEHEEFTFKKNFYLERKIKHGQKEALFAQGYKRLKISPYGDSGAAYYWVKTRYNESKEHAFFCYLIEKELRKHTKEVDLFINNGPDVVIRHHGNAFAFDVETGKNLNRKPEDTRIKFERYRDGYFRSYIFVTNKALKRKYKKMGIVVTRSTLKNVIKAIFS
jgi:hypothetical protein